MGGDEAQQGVILAQRYKQHGADTCIDSRSTVRGRGVQSSQIQDMDQAFPLQQAFLDATGGRWKRLAQQVRKGLWRSAYRDGAEILTIVRRQSPVCCFAKRVRFFQYGIKNWGNVAGR